MKKKNIHFINCPLANYLAQRELFVTEHPTAQVYKEIETVSVAVLQAPKIPGLHTPPQQQVVPMISAALFYEEEVTENSNGLKIIQP